MKKKSAHATKMVLPVCDPNRTNYVVLVLLVLSVLAITITYRLTEKPQTPAECSCPKAAPSVIK